MNKAVLASVTILSVAIFGLAHAQAPSPVPAANVVAVRQAGFGMLYGVWQGLRAGVTAKVEPNNYLLASQGIAAYSRQIPALFPEGSGTGRIGFASIYAERAEFDKAAAAMAAVGDALVKAAQDNDASAFAAGVKKLTDACGACHTKRFADNWFK